MVPTIWTIDQPCCHASELRCAEHPGGEGDDQQHPEALQGGAARRRSRECTATGRPGVIVGGPSVAGESATMGNLLDEGDGVTATVVVRGSGSIGQRHARVLAAGSGPRSTSGRCVHDPALGPTRPRGRASSTTPARRPSWPSADLVVVATDTAPHVADAIEAPRRRRGAGARRETRRAHRGGCRAACRAPPVRRRLGRGAPARPRSLPAPAPSVAEVGTPVGGSAHVWSQSWLPDWRPDRDYRESYSARAGRGRGAARPRARARLRHGCFSAATSLLGAQLDRGGPSGIEPPSRLPRCCGRRPDGFES